MSNLADIISAVVGLGFVLVIRFWLMPKLDLVPRSDANVLANALMILVTLAAFLGPFLGTPALLAALFG